MKKETLIERSETINKSLNYIYSNIETNITLEELAKLNSISKYHFHRIFKEETKETLQDTITSIRLQKAANMLISNSYSTITEILAQCGYSSHSSFIKAFKKRFNFTPKEYKEFGYIEHSKKILKENYIENININIEVDIKIRPELRCIYIRHKGYNKDLKHTWQKLKALAYQLNIKEYEEIGLHHDNPSIVPLDECKYVAAITINNNLQLNEKVSTLTIPELLCATFKYKGKYGEIINLIRYISQEWIVKKGYEITTMPIYIKYEKNHLIGDNKEFEIEVNIPIRVI